MPRIDGAQHGVNAMSLELLIASSFILFLIGCLVLVARELHKVITTHRKFVYTAEQREDEVLREIKKIIEEIQEKANDLERAARRERATRAFKAGKQ